MSWEQALEQETDPVKLRSYVREINKIALHYQSLYEESRVELSKQAQSILGFDDQLCKFKQRMFGKSSEKIPASNWKRESDETQLSLQSQSLAPAPEESERTKLAEQTEDIAMDANELADIAESYGYPRSSEWELIPGLHEESVEYDIEPKKVIKRKIRRFKYRLIQSKGSDKEIIVTTAQRLKLVPGCHYSVNFGLDAVCEKYLYHNALSRQCRRYEELGVKISEKTLYSLCHHVHCHLESLADRIREQILSQRACVHIDETPWPINNKAQDDGYMWVLSNQAGSYYRFESGRAGKYAKELLGSYQGPVVTDGYAGYSWIKEQKGIVHAHCWSHARRQFYDIRKNYSREVDEILSLIRKLFRIEKKAKSFEDLGHKRHLDSASVLKEIEAWLIETRTKARAESGLRKAIDYSLKHWAGLTKFLEDPQIPLTNNEAERTIRQAVMGRKNFHGSRTINGADVATTMYTLIESCKKVELNPRLYLRYALEEEIQGRQAKTPLDYAREIRKN